MLQAITTYLSSIGCEFPDINLLQPADPFLDTTGEDLRRRIFITQENSGTLFCLRPEFTIPVGLYHRRQQNLHARYAYGGKVFRQRRDDATEFTQAGFEDIGDADKPTADVNTIATALGVLRQCDSECGKLVIGDQSIYMTLLDALEIPAAWRKKLVRSFGDDQMLMQQINEMAQSKSSATQMFPPAIVSCLEKEDSNALTTVVTDMMLENGLPLSGGRTPAAIIQRIREKAELGSTRLEADKKKILEAFLKIDVKLEEAAHKISEFANSTGLDLPGSAEALENLASGLSNQTTNARYKASFGRQLDYYTGLVFEIYHGHNNKPVIGGGRYDQLMTLLGAMSEIPAVGFAVWVDRVGAAS